MHFVFLSISIIGLIILSLCVFTIVSPFIGWKYIFPAIEKKTIVQVPKAGVYAICCVFNVHVRNIGFRRFHDVFPNIHFLLSQCSTGEIIEFIPQKDLTSSSNQIRKSISVGYFKATSPGEYLISRTSEIQGHGDEEVLIRKHLSFKKMFMSIIGIIAGALALMFGLVITLEILF